VKRAVAIRHVAFEDLGSLPRFLGAAGYAVSYLDAGSDGLDEAADADLLIVLGGPISVNDEAIFPFLADELSIVRRRVVADVATLGICLGAQMIARALGAPVFPGKEKEIGWEPLTLTRAGLDHPIRNLGESEPVLHWHGETFDLPEDVTLLASTPRYPHQAFAYGDRVLALQFHAETTAEALERWYVGHVGELTAAGISIPELRAASRRHASGLERRCGRFIGEWLSLVGQ
jgi:GMP synthase (glutamine-hydrolysing)